MKKHFWGGIAGLGSETLRDKGKVVHLGFRNLAERKGLSIEAPDQKGKKERSYGGGIYFFAIRQFATYLVGCFQGKLKGNN